MSPAEVLGAAADLLEKPGAWTQWGYASDGRGNPVHYTDASAICFCVRGAVRRVAEESGTDFSLEDFGVPKPSWNDAPERTQVEVVAALREASRQASIRGGEA